MSRPVLHRNPGLGKRPWLRCMSLEIFMGSVSLEIPLDPDQQLRLANTSTCGEDRRMPVAQQMLATGQTLSHQVV